MKENVTGIDSANERSFSMCKQKPFPISSQLFFYFIFYFDRMGRIVLFILLPKKVVELWVTPHNLCSNFMSFWSSSRIPTVIAFSSWESLEGIDLPPLPATRIYDQYPGHFISWHLLIFPTNFWIPYLGLFLANYWCHSSPSLELAYLTLQWLLKPMDRSLA